MKQTKKLLALVLALVMTFSLMAVTAAAAGTEEHEHVCSTETVQPRIPGATCMYCGSGMAVDHTSSSGGKNTTYFWCNNDDCPYFTRTGNRAEKKIDW